MDPSTPLRVRRTLALVDLDAFFVSVERRRDPTLRNRPVVVGGLPGERGVVACASYEARGYGVHAAMPISQAVALLPARCPRCARVRDRHAVTTRDPAHREATACRTMLPACSRTMLPACTRGCPVFLHGDHEAYARASREVMEVLERFTPTVEPVSLDEAYLDLTGLERHHRSWTAAATTLRAAVLEATGLSISVGIGGTRCVAKVAASLAKPAGILVVRPGEERAFLAALPLEHLPGVGAKTQATLERFNLRSIGDLAALPEDLLAATFGRWGPALVRRARGEEDDGGARVGRREPATRSISRETSFAEDTDDRRQVEAMLSHLAQRAAKAMRAEGLRARAVGVRLRYSDFDTVEVRQRFAAPSDLDHDILERVRALLHARWTRRVRLRLVGVVLHDLVESDERQLELLLRAPHLGMPLRAPPAGGMPLRAPHLGMPLRAPPAEGLPLRAPHLGLPLRAPPAEGLPLPDPGARDGEVAPARSATDARRGTVAAQALLSAPPPGVACDATTLAPERVAEAVAPYVPRAVDLAIDRIRDRHGFGALVRGRAIDLLPPSPARTRTHAWPRHPSPVAP